ncbi:hypothetical protein SCHPADRAFT_998797 [Schizopora paradoxa]|uniref:RNI-like protein n=1 Tax=Schizopora paradoxa TaxID=27342 RepID=A0A0H2RQ06_9AGAM|nr:hypothetical protein SCHPADRAFT_998797 [Schizopora paradoxa]
MDEYWLRDFDDLPESESAAHFPDEHLVGDVTVIQDLGLPEAPRYDEENPLYAPELCADLFLARVHSIESTQPGVTLSSFMQRQLERHAVIKSKSEEKYCEVPFSSYADLHNAGWFSSSLPNVALDEDSSGPPSSPLTAAISLRRSRNASGASARGNLLSSSTSSTPQDSPLDNSDILRRLWRLDRNNIIREYLETAKPQSEQDLADTLSKEGLMSPDVLGLFSFARINSLNLSQSMASRDELDAIGCPYFHAFEPEKAFASLTELDVSDVYLSEDDVMHFAHLPQLKELVLKNTGIGDNDLMHLVPLSKTLHHINIAGNTLITDESTTTLIRLYKLDCVVLQGTKFSMWGLRRLIKSFKESLNISPPLHCIKYLMRISDKVQITSRTVSIGSMSEADLDKLGRRLDKLTVVQMKDLLRAIAKNDSSVSFYGTRSFLQKQLKASFKRLWVDILVKRCSLIS